MRTGLELNFCCSPFGFAPPTFEVCIQGRFSSGRLLGVGHWPWAIKSEILHLLESAKLHDSQLCCFCQAFMAFNIAFAFWADDLPLWIDLDRTEDVILPAFCWQDATYSSHVLNEHSAWKNLQFLFISWQAGINNLLSNGKWIRSLPWLQLKHADSLTAGSLICLPTPRSRR